MISDLMLHSLPCESDQTLWVAEVWVEFSPAYEGTKVSKKMPGSHKYSLKPISQILGTSATMGTSFLTSRTLFQMWTSFQGSIK